MVPAWIFFLPMDLIHIKAKEFKLDANLVAAIVMKESRGQSCATRYEPGWSYPPPTNEMRDLASNLGITLITMKKDMATSYGLMQVMGTVAYELGHRGHMVQLCKPRKGLHYGCKKLHKLFQRYGGNMQDVISAYNQGGGLTKLGEACIRTRRSTLIQ